MAASASHTAFGSTTPPPPAPAPTHGPPPPANRRAFGVSSVNSTGSGTSTTAVANTSFRSFGTASTSSAASAASAASGASSASAASGTSSSATTVRSPATNLRASTMSNASNASQHHLAPPFSILGTSPQSSSASTMSGPPSVNASPTPPGPAPAPPSLGVVGRARSQSSASAGGAAQLAAERAGQWLAALAPRGEGRSREFITSTLSGVATVASTVGQEVNGFIKAGGGGSRPSSFVGSPPESRVRTFSRSSRRDSGPTANALASLASQGGSTAGGAGSAAAGAGPGAASTGTDANGRHIPRPANMSRLGGASHQSTHSASNFNLASPITSPTGPGFVRSSTLPTVARSTSPAAAPGAPGSPGAGGTTAGAHERRGSSQSTHSVQNINTGNSGTNGAQRVVHVRSSSTGAINLGGYHSPGVSSSRVRAAGMPYKIGFQPSGVRHDRTAEYVLERKVRAADREKEEGRLGRRWAKLVDLHFNPATQTRPQPVLPQPGTQRKTSLLSMDFDAINPKEVWKGLKMAAGPNPEEARKRAAEQIIVKWEDDADVRKCRICAVSFSLSTRKHHCRLCGRIVCSLPPTPPALLAVQMQMFGEDAANEDALPAGTRREKCSLLLVADYRTGRGEEVDEGFIGWMSLDDGDRGASDPASAFRSKRGERAAAAARARTPAHTRRSSASSSLRSGTTTPLMLPQQPEEVQVKGVRVCRDCWAVVRRKQVMADRARTTPFQRLYVALRSLQAEIEGQLPDFDAELARARAELAKAPEGAAADIDMGDLVAAHKNLLALLGQYDVVAKRISALPCAEGGSQATVQGALARSAATFLAKAMVQVAEVPKLERAVAAAKAKHLVVVETRLPDVLRAEGVQHDAAEEIARALQPLLEQQAQLESFIAEANAQRKYDDSRSLAAALAEIEAEIGRLTTSALQ